MSTEQEVNWDELSDDEIAAMSSPDDTIANKHSQGSDPNLAESGEEESSKDVTDQETGGADPETNSSENSDESKDDSVTNTDDTGNQDPFSGTAGDSSKDDQSKDKEVDKKAVETKDTDPDEVDWKAKYEEVMAPFKAAKREVQVNNPEEARRLMQQGVDYSRKMQMMKPYQRILHTLEKANLLDPDRINFLIDLDKKNPAAIKKLLQDSSIDPTELSLGDSDDDYKPANHAVSDQEVDIRDAFDSIAETDTFDKTVEIVTKQWDGKSRAALRDNPQWIPLINDHVADGTFDKVWAYAERERMFGRLGGLSDLDAYYQAGEAMSKAGLLADQQQQQAAPSTAGKATQGSAQGNGSPQNPKTDVKDLKRAASPTRGKPSSGGAKKNVDYGALSDEEIEKIGIPSSL